MACKSKMKLSLSKMRDNYRLFITFGCFIVFVMQLGYLIPEYIEPTKLNRNTEIINVADLEEFPLVFKFCIRPGLNMTELKRAGYPDIDNYFWGTMHSTLDSWDPDVGWDGKNSSLSPAGDNLSKQNASSLFVQGIIFPSLLRNTQKGTCGEVT